jgi:hypothetical protein
MLRFSGTYCCTQWRLHLSKLPEFPQRLQRAKAEDFSSSILLCQQLRRNGEQCKAPALKGEILCYKHREQLEAERRRGRFALPPLTDTNAVRRVAAEIAQALMEDRIDEDYAGELLARLRTASRQLRPPRRAAGK